MADCIFSKTTATTPISHALLQSDLSLLYIQAICAFPLESKWVFDCFGQKSMVGVRLWVITGDSSPALLAGILAFGALRSPRCKEAMEWPHVDALVSSPTLQSILAQLPDMGV